MSQYLHRARIGIVALAVAVACSLGTVCGASFHFMQMEMVIGGVNGDPTAQAIQLRMRAASQHLLSNARIRCFDAAGQNPITIINFTTNVTNTALGSRVLIVSPNFGNYTGPEVVPDFVMTNLIPESRLAAGRLTFEADGGVIFWSLSWGGSGYTGSTTGDLANDDNGNFGPSFAGPLPSTGISALKFKHGATAKSTTNAADYEVPAGAAVFTNNAGNSFTVCPTDFNQDGFLNGDDFDEFVAAFELGDDAADYNGDEFVNGDDFDGYVLDFEVGC